MEIGGWKASPVWSSSHELMEVEPFLESGPGRDFAFLACPLSALLQQFSDVMLQTKWLVP